MAKKIDSDIVGWITRGGKRIPIRRGNSSKDKPEWKKYDEEQESEDFRKGRKFSDEVKAEAKKKADEYNKIPGRGDYRDVEKLMRRTQYYAKKQGVDDVDFADYVMAVASRRKNTVHKTKKKPLKYDNKAAKAFKEAGFDVASPEEVAKMMGRKVRK